MRTHARRTQTNKKWESDRMTYFCTRPTTRLMPCDMCRRWELGEEDLLASLARIKFCCCCFFFCCIEGRDIVRIALPPLRCAAHVLNNFCPFTFSRVCVILTHVRVHVDQSFMSPNVVAQACAGCAPMPLLPADGTRSRLACRLRLIGGQRRQRGNPAHAAATDASFKPNWLKHCFRVGA